MQAWFTGQAELKVLLLPASLAKVRGSSRRGCVWPILRNSIPQLVLQVLHCSSAALVVLCCITSFTLSGLSVWEHMCLNLHLSLCLSHPSLLSPSVRLSGCHNMLLSQAGHVTTCRLGSGPNVCWEEGDIWWAKWTKASGKWSYLQFYCSGHTKSRLLAGMWICFIQLSLKKSDQECIFRTLLRQESGFVLWPEIPSTGIEWKVLSFCRSIRLLLLEVNMGLWGRQLRFTKTVIFDFLQLQNFLKVMVWDSIHTKILHALLRIRTLD